MTTTRSKEYLLVYGTLKVGFGNHGWMEGKEPIGECTAKDCAIFAGNGLPFAMRKEGSTLHGELYGPVDMDFVKHVDLLESHPDWYKRELTKVMCNGIEYEAWIYFCEDGKNYPEIEGQWKQ